MTNSDETKQAVRDLWMQGYSARNIGNRMGKTRRAIIGIVYRLGLTRIERPANPAPHKQLTRNQYSGRRPIKAVLGHKRSDGSDITIKDVPMPEPSVAARTGYRKDGKLTKMADLRSNSCRWPIGDPQDIKFGYCGAQTDSVCPYCVIHKKIAYYPPERRVRRVGA